jgi:DNA-binding CsgD family transcriptional regulator
MESVSYRYEAVDRLRHAVGFDAWCWALLDPICGLASDATAWNPVVGSQQRRFHKAVQEDRRSGLAPGVSEAAVSRLSQVTGGDLERSLRWREILGPGGLGDELSAHLVVDGSAWGHLVLYRGADRARFCDADCEFVFGLASLFARHSRDDVRSDARVLDGDSLASVTVVLDDELNIVATTPDPLGVLRASGDEPLPPQLYALGALVESSRRDDPTSQRQVRLRLRGSDGRWLVAQAAPLLAQASGVSGSVVLTVEPARSEALAPLLMCAHGLSARERDVAALLIDGLGTKEIAGTLFISAHTVRDHIKALFSKVGVNRRRDLVSFLAGTAGP